MAKRRRNWDWPRISGWFALLFAPARADARFARTKGDYVRMLLQCLLGIAALLLPRVLHTLSGAMLGALGFSVLTFLNKTEGIPVSRSPAFVALFTFCFALALDALFQTNMQKYALEGGEALAGQAALQGHHGGPDRGLHRGAGHRHRGLPLPQAREGEPRARADPQAAQPGGGTGAQGRSATRGGRGQTARALLLFCPQRSSILRARSSVTGSTRAQMRQPASPYSSSSTDPYLCRKETTSPRS